MPPRKKNGPGKAKPRDHYVRDEAIINDWRLGEMRKVDIANKHKVCASVVTLLTKGVEQDGKAVYNQGMAYNQQLAQIYEENANFGKLIEDTVERKSNDMRFFRGASIQIAASAIRKVQADPDISMGDIELAQRTVSRAQETVCGKAPEIAVHVGDNNQQNNGMSYEDIIRCIREARE